MKNMVKIEIILHDPYSNALWGVWSGREAFPQELYGEDLVTAMTNRVNFTVNHYHQVKDPGTTRVK